MKLNLIEFPSKMFIWNEKNEVIAEASDLRNQHLQRMYDDAMDIGFAIKSGVTGKVIVFSMSTEHKNSDGDVTFWEYHPTWESIKNVPECTNWVAKIFND